MKIQIILICLLVATGQVVAQNNKKATQETVPTQSEMEMLMKEAQKALEELSPEDKKMMEQMGVSMPQNIGFTNQQIAGAWEEEGKIVPAIRSDLIAQLPKKTFNAAELNEYLTSVNTAVANGISADARKMGDQIILQAKGDKYYGALLASAANGLWVGGFKEIAVYIMGKVTQALPNADNYNNLAAYLTMTGAAHIAIPMLQTLNNVHRQNSTILNNLGHAWLQLGEAQKAKMYLDSATMIYAAHPQANYTKCLILEEEGNIPEATVALEKSLKHSVTKTKLNKLKQLEKKSYKPSGYRVPQAYSSVTFNPAAYAALIPKEYAQTAGVAVERKWQDFRDYIQDEINRIEATAAALNPIVQQEDERVSQKAVQKKGITFSPNYYKAVEEYKLYSDAKIRQIQNKVDRNIGYQQEWTALKQEFSTTLKKEKQSFSEKVANGANLQINCEGELPIISKYVTAINLLNKTHNEELVQDALREAYDLFHLQTNAAIGDATALLTVLDIKKSFLSVLLNLKHEYYDGLPADCAGREKELPFDHGKLPDYDEVNCNYLDVVHFYGMGTWTIRCNNMTMDLNPILLPFKGSLTGNFDGFIENISVGVTVKAVDINTGVVFDKNGSFVKATGSASTSIDVEGPLKAVFKGISISVSGEVDAGGYTKGSAELGLESAMKFIPGSLESEAPVEISLKNKLGVAIEVNEDGFSDMYIKNKVSGTVASNIEQDTDVETAPGMIDKFGNKTGAETVDLQEMINQLIDPENETINSPSVSVSADNRWCVNTGYTSSKGSLSGLRTNYK